MIHSVSGFFMKCLGKKNGFGRNMALQELVRQSERHQFLYLARMQRFLSKIKGRELNLLKTTIA